MNLPSYHVWPLKLMKITLSPGLCIFIRLIWKHGQLCAVSSAQIGQGVNLAWLGSLCVKVRLKIPQKLDVHSSENPVMFKALSLPHVQNVSGLTVVANYQGGSISGNWQPDGNSSSISLVCDTNSHNGPCWCAWSLNQDFVAGLTTSQPNPGHTEQALHKVTS